ncbi:polymer-forming cytoskeletal protein [Hydrogenophaga sp.]|uniref:bactofilin family protein n=1 Tax=Hydrogenophaga sp. TaxID=1904254 RepID=UPI0026246D1E|nr:polymer-forming cytoskeletal protein [Hydrogenophaga sp.]MCW5654713.1 polymer-forming cytoskeletal protein [Hydrogenophaga sp.]
MDPKATQDTLTIDPIAMAVVSRVAAGSVLSGDLEFDGGLLVQGTLSGNIRVRGRLIIWTGGSVRGRVQVDGDLYLFGQLGASGASPHETHLECQGMVYISKTGVSTGTLLARRLQLYEGASLQGPFKTLKLDASPPTPTQRP